MKKIVRAVICNGFRIYADSKESTSSIALMVRSSTFAVSKPPPKPIHELLFADDMALMAHSEEDLQLSSLHLQSLALASQ